MSGSIAPKREGTERWLYEVIRRLQLKADKGDSGFAAIIRGEVPDGSGNPIIRLDDYFYLPGRPGGQLAHFATEASGSGTLSSTKSSTKGKIYLGTARTSVFDEANEYLGLGTATPSARAHIIVPAALSDFSRPVTVHDNSAAIIWVGDAGETTNLQNKVNKSTSTSSSDTTYIVHPRTLGTITFTMDAVDPPAVDTGHKIKIRARVTGTPIAGSPFDHLTITLTVGAGANVLSGGSRIPILADGAMTNDFDEYIYELTEAEAAGITNYSDLRFSMTYYTGFDAGTYIHVSAIELEVPGGTGDAVPLQKWADGTRENILQYTLDGNAVPTMELTGSVYRVATTGFEIDIGTPVAGHVWTATNTEGLGAWQDPDHNLLASTTHSDTVTGSVVLGDIIYGNSTPKWTRLGGNTTSTKKFLSQTGNGTISAAPSWEAITSSDIAHTLLNSSYHTDTVTQDVSPGSLIYGNSTPKWDELTIGTSGNFLRSTGTAPEWTALTAAMLPTHDHSSASTGGSTLQPLVLNVRGGQASIEITGSAETSLRFKPDADSGAGIIANEAGSRTIDTKFYLPFGEGLSGSSTIVTWNSTFTSDLPLRGSLLIGGFNGDFPMEQLGIGVAGQLLRVNSGATAPEWVTAETVIDTARTWDTLQSFRDDAFKVVDNLDTTKTLIFSLGGASTGADLTIEWNGTADRTLTLPNVTDTVTANAAAQTLTNKTINLTSNTLTGTTAQFNTALSDNDFATLAGSETLTNKTVNLTSNTLTGTKAQFDTALSDDNFGYLATAQTWTNENTYDGTGATTPIKVKFDSVSGTANAIVLQDAASADATVFLIDGVIGMRTTTNGFSIAESGVSDLLSGVFQTVTFAVGSLTSNRICTFPNATGTVPLLNALPGSSGLVLFASGTAGQVTTDPDFSFTTDTLTVTKIAATQFTGNVTIADTINVVLNTTTGTKIGTGTTQKLGFWNATPVAQYATTGTTTGFTAGAGTTVVDGSTFTGNTGSTAYTIGDIVRALKLSGIIAS